MILAELYVTESVAGQCHAAGTDVACRYSGRQHAINTSDVNLAAMPGWEGDQKNAVELELLPCSRDDVKSVAFMTSVLIKREVEFCHAATEPSLTPPRHPAETLETALAPDPKPDSLATKTAALTPETRAGPTDKRVNRSTEVRAAGGRGASAFAKKPQSVHRAKQSAELRDRGARL